MSSYLFAPNEINPSAKSFVWKLKNGIEWESIAVENDGISYGRNTSPWTINLGDVCVLLFSSITNDPVSPPVFFSETGITTINVPVGGQSYPINSFYAIKENDDGSYLVCVHVDEISDYKFYNLSFGESGDPDWSPFTLKNFPKDGLAYKFVFFEGEIYASYSLPNQNPPSFTVGTIDEDKIHWNDLNGPDFGEYGVSWGTCNGEYLHFVSGTNPRVYYNFDGSTWNHLAIPNQGMGDTETKSEAPASSGSFSNPHFDMTAVSSSEEGISFTSGNISSFLRIDNDIYVILSGCVAYKSNLTHLSWNKVDGWNLPPSQYGYTTIINGVVFNGKAWLQAWPTNDGKCATFTVDEDGVFNYLTDDYSSIALVDGKVAAWDYNLEFDFYENGNWNPSMHSPYCVNRVIDLI